jgi:phage terminase small subunit
VVVYVKLTPKQQRFADEWLIDMNGTAAAIRAGYSVKSAEVTASKLLRNAKVRAYIDARMAELSRRTGVNQERIIRELARIAFVNPPEVVDMDEARIMATATEDDTAAIASVKVKTIPTENGTGIEREIRFADKIKALELLGKRFGMWIDKQQVDVQGAVQIVDDVPRDEA